MAAQGRLIDMDTLRRELEELLEAVAPSVIDLDELDRLVARDEASDAFDGECSIHDGCRPVS